MPCHVNLGLPGSPAWVGIGQEGGLLSLATQEEPRAETTIVSALSTCTEVTLQSKTGGLTGSAGSKLNLLPHILYCLSIKLLRAIKNKFAYYFHVAPLPFSLLC